MKARLPWLLLYVIVNIIAASIMLDSGELIGDVAGGSLYSRSALFWATVLVVLPYFLILGPVFNFVSRIKIQPIKFGADTALLGEKIGKLLIVLQLSFALFNLTVGVNIAGSGVANKTDSPFSVFWVLVPIDTLFVIYYGMYRENRYFYPNLVTWVVSNLSRGWVGIFMTIIFFEWCRSVRNRKVAMSRVVLIGVIVLLLYPLLTYLKWIIRATAVTGLTYEVVIDKYVDFFDSGSYLFLMGAGILHLIARLQETSLMVEVIRLSDLLQADFSNGEFAPFWMEGLHGIIFDRLFFGEKSMFIGVAFTKYLSSTDRIFDIGSYNVSLGYASWFFIVPYLIPVYIAYTLFLGFVSFFLVKKIGMSTLSEDMLWYLWMGLLLPAWLAVFVNFVYALLLFLIIKIIFTCLPTVRFLPKVKYQSYPHHHRP